MRNKHLNLNELKVTSFITEIEKDKLNKLKAGVDDVVISQNGPNGCGEGPAETEKESEETDENNQNGGLFSWIANIFKKKPKQ